MRLAGIRRIQTPCGVIVPAQSTSYAKKYIYLKTVSYWLFCWQLRLHSARLGTHPCCHALIQCNTGRFRMSWKFPLH